MKKVWLLTTGDGSDGNEWGVESIHSSEASALKAKVTYEKPISSMRKNGSSYTYTREANIEEWDVVIDA